ncbi:hypothetical protein THASP1DRAFT_31698, partial [Thamnocephalis sphaerospora]
ANGELLAFYARCRVNDVDAGCLDLTLCQPIHTAETDLSGQARSVITQIKLKQGRVCYAALYFGHSQQGQRTELVICFSDTREKAEACVLAAEEHLRLLARLLTAEAAELMRLFESQTLHSYTGPSDSWQGGWTTLVNEGEEIKVQTNKSRVQVLPLGITYQPGFGRRPAHMPHGRTRRWQQHDAHVPWKRSELFALRKLHQLLGDETLEAEDAASKMRVEMMAAWLLAERKVADIYVQLKSKAYQQQVTARLELPGDEENVRKMLVQDKHAAVAQQKRSQVNAILDKQATRADKMRELDRVLGLGVAAGDVSMPPLAGSDTSALAGVEYLILDGLDRPKQDTLSREERIRRLDQLLQLGE